MSESMHGVALDRWNERTPITGPLWPTTCVGPYRLVRHLATGGMAELHLARSIDDDRLVVVKRILPELARDDAMVRMFLDEATIAASLRHRNVARTLDVGRSDGDFYLAMEFLRGANVRELLRRLGTTGTPLPISRSLAIVIGACRGVHYAHEKCSDETGAPLDIVHRDISPHNIFVTYDGVAKVVDFGIARAATRLSKTRPGTLLGKLHYMSPEQCVSADLDRRTDVFSLAILLWELTTGTRLYRGRCELDILKAIVDTEAPRPSTVRPGYPAALERIVMKGLERDPDARYQTAQAMQHDLENLTERCGIDVGERSLSRFMHEVFADRVGIDAMRREPIMSHLPDRGDESLLECVVVDQVERAPARGGRARFWIYALAAAAASAISVVAC